MSHRGTLSKPHRFSLSLRNFFRLSTLVKGASQKSLLTVILTRVKMPAMPSQSSLNGSRHTSSGADSFTFSNSRHDAGAKERDTPMPDTDSSSSCFAMRSMQLGLAGQRGAGSAQERQRGVVSPVGNGDNNGQAAAASIHSIIPKEMNNFVVIPISMYTFRRPGAARRAGRVIAISLEGSTSAEVALLLPLLPRSCQRERAVQERCVPTATKRALRL